MNEPGQTTDGGAASGASGTALALAEALKGVECAVWDWECGQPIDKDDIVEQRRVLLETINVLMGRDRDHGLAAESVGGTPRECDGSSLCEAETHIHGCFAERREYDVLMNAATAKLSDVMAERDATVARAEAAERERDELRESLRPVPTDEGGPGKEETYWLRGKLRAAITHLRDVEDYYRVQGGLPLGFNMIRADRARDLYEAITEDFVNGKRDRPTRAELERAVGRLEEALRAARPFGNGMDAVTERAFKAIIDAALVRTGEEHGTEQEQIVGAPVPGASGTASAQTTETEG